MGERIVALALALTVLIYSISAVAARAPLTNAAAVQTTRFLNWCYTEGRPVCWSPDRRNYVILTLTGDLEKNVNWLTIRLGNADPGHAPSAPTEIGKLSMSSLGDEGNDEASNLTFYSAAGSTAQWLNNETLVFRWGSASNIIQLFAINIKNHSVRQLTDERGGVRQFVVGAGRVIYTAGTVNADSADQQLIENGFAVTNPDLLSLLQGRVSGRGIYDQMLDSYIRIFDPEDSNSPVSITLGASPLNRSPVSVIAISPDGTHAVVNGEPLDVPENWSRYTEPTTREHLAELRNLGPRAVGGRLVTQLYLVDLATGSSHPLIDAPLSPSDMENFADAYTPWSPDGSRILFSHALLPTEQSDGASLAGNDALVVNIHSGVLTRIPLAAKWWSVRGGAARWLDDAHIVFSHAKPEAEFALSDGAWLPVTLNNPLEDIDATSDEYTIEVQEDLNTPPRLVSIDRASAIKQVLLDPNPDLKDRLSLGHVEKFAWRDKRGRDWGGLLFYPVNYDAALEYPLVVQMHGYEDAKFTLYGMSGTGLGPGNANNVAQALANKGFVVLQMEQKKRRPEFNSPLEAKEHMQGTEAAVESLARRGLVDPKKVGLIGISRTGWHVLYALEHSIVPFAAALVAHDSNPSYIWSAALSWSSDNALMIGAEPFGRGLRKWLQASPGFNVERIHAPLQLDQSSQGLAGVVLEWELFSRLRYLGRAVELYVVPDVHHASDSLQNPRQLAAVNDGTVDWFDFWLNGHEDADPAKAEQYKRWENLCDMQIAVNPDRQAFCVPTKAY